MSYQTLDIERDERGVVTLWLARPDKRNALSATMITELTHAAATLGADPDVRVVILAGRGEVFCAGGDLGWMMAQIEADRAARMAEARRLATMLSGLNAMPKPLIGRVHGDAFGGGIGLMAVCDQVLVANHARFALTETRLGLIPATIAPYVVARIGEGAARRIALSGRRFGADHAVQMGLATSALAPDALDAAISEEVAAFLATAPGAVGAAKALLRSLSAPIDDAVIDASIQQLADIWETEEARAGLAAFLEKRAMPWRDR